MTQVKDLYIGKSMKELNEKCNADFDKDKSIKTHLNMVNKLYQGAEAAFSSKDEERAYVLYMRYVEAMMKIRKTKEYRAQSDHYNNLFGTTKLTSAVERAEKLSESLKKRYSKLEKLNGSGSAKENGTKKTDAKADTKLKQKDNRLTENGAEYVFPTTSITIQDLYCLLNKSDKKVLLMDIRSSNDYQDSHYIHPSCINVPNNAITPGSVPSKIMKGIPLDHINLWNTRDTFDLIVLVDWHSNVKRLDDKSDPLRSLKDSIFKWEMEKTLIREPVVLDGGYAEWIESFPQFTSNPHVQPPDNKPKTSNINALLDFNYSDLKSNFSNESITAEKETELKHEITNGFSNASYENQEKQPMLVKRTPDNEKADISLPKTSNKASKIPGMYPDVNAKVPETNQSLKSPKTSTHTIPSIDRSTKPASKSPSEISEASVNMQASVVNNHTDSELITDLKVDRSKKPLNLVNKNVTTSLKPEFNENHSLNAKKNELNKLEKNIEKLKHEKEEREKRLFDIEEKKHAHLLKVEETMKRETKELEEKEMKAKHDLASTMRQSKPDLHIPNQVKQLEKDFPNHEVKNDSSKHSNKTALNDNANKENLNSNFSANAENVQDKNNFEKRSSVSSKASSVGSSNEKSKSFTPQTKLSSEIKSNGISTPKENQTPKISNTSFPVNSSIKAPSSNVASESNLAENSSSSKTKSSLGTPSSSSVHYAPLKDNTDSQTSFGLKRSFSSPNLAKMVQPESSGDSISTISSKPSKTITPQPNRGLKPNLQEEFDPYLQNLSRSLRVVHGGEGPTKCGLRNLGNSCYMNSVLQCMFSTTHLADYILSNRYRPAINQKNVLGYGGKVAECFAVLLRAFWVGQYRYLIPSDMKQIAGSINDTFSGYSQEDSHEFLLFLLDGLHEDMNRITNYKYESEPDNDNKSDLAAAEEAWRYHKKRNESIIVELFTGQYKATLVCLHCGKTSRKFDAFRFLTLSLPSHSTTLENLVKDFGKREKLVGDDRWKCPNCKVLREAYRTIEIWKLPPILIIHLKRFVHSGRWRDKIHSHIDFPTGRLNLSNYTCGALKRGDYELYAVSHHHGAGLDSGHYTSSCRSVVDGKWYKYDDTEVTHSSPPRDSSAFILFYSSLTRQMPNIQAIR